MPPYSAEEHPQSAECHTLSIYNVSIQPVVDISVYDIDDQGCREHVI